MILISIPLWSYFNIEAAKVGIIGVGALFPSHYGLILTPLHPPMELPKYFHPTMVLF